MIIIPAPIEPTNDNIIPFINKPFTLDTQKQCINLGTYTLTNGSTVDFYSYNQNGSILGVDKDIVIFVLALQPFKYSLVIKQKLGLQALQVFRTYVSVDHRRLGITTHAYEAFVSSGKYSLVCGQFQTVPMLSVWKNMAVNSSTTAFELDVIDKEVIRVDVNNKPIVYDGTNIPDSELWSTLPDRLKEDTLLFLRQKSDLTTI